MRNKPVGLTKRQAVDRSQSLDIVVSSLELKKLILQRVRETGIPLSEICSAMNIRKYKLFKELYLDCAKPVADNYYVTQENIILIARELNIRVRVQIVIDEIDPKKKEFYNSKPLRWTDEYRYPE